MATTEGQKLTASVKALIDEQTKTLITSDTQHSTTIEAQLSEIKAQLNTIQDLLSGAKKPIKEAGKDTKAPAASAETIVSPKSTGKNLPLNPRAYFIQAYKNAEYKAKYEKPDITEFVSNDESYKTKTTPDAKKNAEASAVWKYLQTHDKAACEAVKKEYEALKSKQLDTSALTVEPL
jgi:hypothetical protein